LNISVFTFIKMVLNYFFSILDVMFFRCYLIFKNIFNRIGKR
jgi:hypothetical protein